MLAGAPGYSPGFRNFHFLRAKGRSFVRTIAEGLAFGPATSAPPIDAGLDFLDDGRFLKNGRFVHHHELNMETKTCNPQLI
jgi:hypothetical protein